MANSNRATGATRATGNAGDAATPALATKAPAMDITRRYVRVLGERGSQFIEFEFAIGEPELFVEMILSRDAFYEFCITNQVDMLPAHGDSDAPISDWDWRLSDATRTRFR